MQFIVPSHGLLFLGLSMWLAIVYAVAGFVGMHAVTKEEISKTNMVRISNMEQIISNVVIFPIVLLLIDNQEQMKFLKADTNLYWLGIVIILIPLVLAFMIISGNLSNIGNLNTVDNNIFSKKVKYNILYIFVTGVLFYIFYKYVPVPKISFVSKSLFVPVGTSPDVTIAPHFFIRILLAILVIFVLDISICLFIGQRELNESKTVVNNWTSIISWCRNVFIIPLMISTLDTASDYRISVPYFYDLIVDIFFMVIAGALFKYADNEKKVTTYSETNTNLTIRLEVLVVVGITWFWLGQQFCYIASSIHYFQKC